MYTNRQLVRDFNHVSRCIIAVSVLTGLSGSVLVLLKLSGEETDLDISTCCSPTPCMAGCVYQVAAKASPPHAPLLCWQCLSSFRWRWFLTSNLGWTVNLLLFQVMLYVPRFSYKVMQFQLVLFELLLGTQLPCWEMPRGQGSTGWSVSRINSLTQVSQPRYQTCE